MLQPGFCFLPLWLYCGTGGSHISLVCLLWLLRDSVSRREFSTLVPANGVEFHGTCFTAQAGFHYAGGRHFVGALWRNALFGEKAYIRPYYNYLNVREAKQCF